jgi:hypothetical protein
MLPASKCASVKSDAVNVSQIEIVDVDSFGETLQLGAALLPLAYFAMTLALYICLGLRNTTDNQFSERNFSTTWGRYMLKAAETGGVSLIFGGFLYSQFLT